MPGAVVIGAGPGIGLSVAIRFAREGMPITAIARAASTVEATAKAITAMGGTAIGLVADSTDEAGLRASLDVAVERHGTPDVLVYNVAWIRPDRPGELSTRQHLDAWAVNVVGAITAVAHIGPQMAEHGRGTIIITGGMPEAEPGYVSLSLGKAGVRALTELLAKEYGPAGVHVATVTVCGPVAPDTDFDPDDIAEHYWTLHRQPPDAWEREIEHWGTPT